MGPNPLLWSEVEAWMRLTGHRVLGHEIEWIFAIDAEFMAAQAQAARRER